MAEAAEAEAFAVSAAAMLIFQMMLNVLGSMDILPFTGVTFPFVSRGGSSLIACWGILAFIKACDTRQNASFTVRVPGRRKRNAADVDEDVRIYVRGSEAEHD